MSTIPRRKSRRGPAVDRRASADSTGPAVARRRVRGALGRRIGLERRDGQLHVVLVERRKAPRSAGDEPSISDLREVLRDRLLAVELESRQAAQVMRHLVRVYMQLGRKGWAGVEALPGRTLDLALVQAEMLASEQASPRLSFLIDRLRTLKTAADVREERKARLQQADPDLERSILVSEATHEEFVASERVWDSAPPSELPEDAAAARES